MASLLCCLAFAGVSCSHGSNVAEFAASEDMDLLTGYDFMKGVRPPAMEMLQDCSKAGPQEACILEDHAEVGTSYTQEVKSSSSYSTFMKSVTKAEGGAFGVTVSTGVTAVDSSQTTASSWTFFAGESLRVSSRHIQNYQYLKLLPGAKALLQKDARGFLDKYGQHYAYSVIYGGSFLGYCSLTERQSYSSSDLDVFAGVKASILFFSASASEHFENKTSQASSSLRSKCSQNWRGGEDIRMNTTPVGIGAAFSKWQDTVRDDPKPLVMIARTWIDSDEVSAIVNTFEPEVRALFNNHIIVDTTSERLAAEEAQMLLIKHSIQEAAGWPAVTASRSMQQELEALDNRVNSHDADLKALGDSGIIARQNEIIAGHFSWFVASKLLADLEDFKANLTIHCGSVPIGMCMTGCDPHLFQPADGIHSRNKCFCNYHGTQCMDEEDPHGHFPPSGCHCGTVPLGKCMTGCDPHLFQPGDGIHSRNKCKCNYDGTICSKDDPVVYECPIQQPISSNVSLVVV